MKALKYAGAIFCAILGATAVMNFLSELFTTSSFTSPEFVGSLTGATLLTFGSFFGFRALVRSAGRRPGAR